MSFNVFNLSELQSVLHSVFDSYDEHVASLDKIIDNAAGLSIIVIPNISIFIRCLIYNSQSV